MTLAGDDVGRDVIGPARQTLQRHSWTQSYIFYAGVSLAGVSCRRRWPPPTTPALTTLLG